MTVLTTNQPAPGFWTDAADYAPGVNRLFLSFLSGASGAVPTSYLKSDGFDVNVTAVVRDAAGSYTATLSSYWAAYFRGGGSVRQTAGTYDPAKAFDVKVFAVDLTAKTVKFVTVRPDTGVAIDMESGDILDLTLELGAYTEPTPAGAS